MVGKRTGEKLRQGRAVACRPQCFALAVCWAVPGSYAAGVNCQRVTLRLSGSRFRSWSSYHVSDYPPIATSVDSCIKISGPDSASASLLVVLFGVSFLLALHCLAEGPTTEVTASARTRHPRQRKTK